MSAGLPPLTARSVLLSVLLGSHPPRLPVQTLVRTAELFGVSEGTARVALSRLVSEGEVAADAGLYRLSPRLLSRQHDQDEALRPRTRPWRGRWEIAVAAPEIATAGERSGLGARLHRLRLAELRPGVWGRPANLARLWPADLDGQALRFSAVPSSGASQLAARMWDLGGWARGAESLIASMASSRSPAERFSTAAAMVRHLRADPVLPASLLPRRWPGARLRAAYRRYEAELAGLLAEHSARQRAV